jgi:uncharacterized membrane protein
MKVGMRIIFIIKAIILVANIGGKGILNRIEIISGTTVMVIGGTKVLDGIVKKKFLNTVKVLTNHQLLSAHYILLQPITT